MASARNLLVFSDGTGNAGGLTRSTNVWRLYNSIDRHPPAELDVEQRLFYDDGVGTKDSLFWKVAGGALGIGLGKNICQLYEWLVLNHKEPGDRVFLFGFSRGAFTVRCLAGMIARCGLLEREAYEHIPVRERGKHLRGILRAFRAAKPEYFDEWRRRNPATSFKMIRVHFVGVWDTVDAVGMPIDELKPITDWAWRKLLGRRAYGFYDQTLRGVEHARQALALDDERRTFHPNVWHLNPDLETLPDDATNPDNIEQVWFAGAHSNVGGGYPKDELANVTLDWMLGELEALGDEGPILKPDARRQVQDDADEHGLLYDPRTGLGVYYRYSPRRPARFYQGMDDFWYRWIGRRLRGGKVAPLPERGIKVHASVWRRLESGTQGYAPLFLPDPGPSGSSFKLATAFTKCSGPYSAGERDSLKLQALGAKVTTWVHRVRDETHGLVVQRQVAYVLFVMATALALWFGVRADAPVVGSGFFWLVKKLIPDLLGVVVDAAVAHKGYAAAFAVVIVGAGCWSLWLRRTIEGRALSMYEENFERERRASPPPAVRFGGEPPSAGAPRVGDSSTFDSA